MSYIFVFIVSHIPNILPYLACVLNPEFCASKHFQTYFSIITSPPIEAARVVLVIVWKPDHRKVKGLLSALATLVDMLPNCRW